MKQTAVEWLYERLSNTSIDEFLENIDNLFEQAKEIEKQQKYSEKEVLRIITYCKEYLSFGGEFNEIEWFNKFKKK